MCNHIVTLNLLHNFLLFAIDLKQCWQEEEESEARCSPQHLEGETLYNGEDVVHFVDGNLENVTVWSLEESTFHWNTAGLLLCLSTALGSKMNKKS